jgi:hydroxymethylpyrimidine pyrophosphatase-like HAD family hydrolase
VILMDKRKTWFLDFDGTIVYQKSYLKDEDYILPKTIDFFTNFIKENDFVIITTGREEHHKERIEKFMRSFGLKCDLIICGLPTGIRILVNDMKPDGTKTAQSHNLERDQGLNFEDL